MGEEKPRESVLKTWVVLFLLLALIIIKGFFTFFHVGDRGQPDWDYRPVRDVPGQSPYAMYKLLPHPQHVRGTEGE
jgi:hypothetical protein